MPNNSGASSFQLSWRMKAMALILPSMKLDATPEIMNSSPRLQGADSIMYDSGVSLANGLFTCQPHVT